MIHFLRALCLMFFAVVINGAAFADDNYAALREAVGSNDIAEVKRLIDGGADVGANDKSDRAPLYHAVSRNHAEIALALIQAGADANARSSGNYTALHWAAFHGQIQVALALVNAGADIVVKSSGSIGTPLDVAIEKYGKNSVIAFFLQGVMDRKSRENKQKAEALLRELK